MKLQKLHEQSFDWLSWRSGDLTDLIKLPTREEFIVKNKEIIRTFAIGYLESDNLPCRAKEKYIAVMFEMAGIQWWTHFTKNEFYICFPELK